MAVEEFCYCVNIRRLRYLREMNPIVLTHGGEADSDGRGLANVLKHFGFAVASDVMRHLKVAKGTYEMEAKEVCFMH